MIDGKKIVSLVPLRGGSKSIPSKNIKELAGKPLCYWVLKAAADSKYIDEVWVSTDDKKIKDVVISFGLGVKVLDRPAELAEDTSSTESVMLHFMEQGPDFDILNLIQATSPSTTTVDLDSAIELFQKNGYDSLLTGMLYKKFFWTPDGRPLNYDYRKRPRRQDFAGAVHENGAFYLTRKEVLAEEKNRLGGRIGIYVFPNEVIDIDEPADWPIAEKYLLSALKKINS